MFEQNIFGLDIGVSTIKVSLIKETLWGYKIVGQNLVQTIDKCFSKNGFRDIKTTAADLNKALATAQPHSIKAKNFYTALPETMIFTKLISLPTRKSNEIEKMVNLQIAEVFPLPAGELYTDYRVQAQIDRHSIVQIEAASRGVIDSFIKLADLAKLNILGIETKPISLVRLLAHPQKNGLIVDIGSQQVSFALSMKGLIRMTATAPLGVERTKDHSVLIKQIAREISEFLRFFTSKTKVKPTDLDILLTGGGARVENMIKDISSATGIEVKEAFPLYKIKPFHPRFSASLSLALKKYYE